MFPVGAALRTLNTGEANPLFYVGLTHHRLTSKEECASTYISIHKLHIVVIHAASTHA